MQMGWQYECMQTYQALGVEVEQLLEAREARAILSAIDNHRLERLVDHLLLRIAMSKNMPVGLNSRTWRMMRW
jgi:hypothetical protein